MAMNIPQYQPSGDMMSVINEYWSGRPEGSDHNAEWAGAAPGEYWTRKYGEALNWKRGQQELLARKQAEELRLKMEQQKQKYQQDLQRRQEANRKTFEDNKVRFQQQSDAARSQLQSLQSNLQSQAGADKEMLSGLLSSMLGQYDTGFNTLSSKFGEFKDFSSANTQSGDDLASQFGINANQQLSQQPMSYTPNIYIPDVSTLISAANKIDPLMQQAQAKFQETYGWNQDRLKQETEPYANSYNQQKSSLGQSISGLGNSFIQQAQQLYNPGMYDQSQYNSALSTEQNLSQRLRQGEQGVLSQLNEMFNSASTFANKAENAYNTEKANRLNERAAIQGQQQNDMIGSRVGQAEKNAAQQVSNRRQNTMLSFNPENQNLLSYLTRGY